MYLPLILFFISLVGIVVMIGRKLMLAGHIEITEENIEHPFMGDLRKIKDFSVVSIRKYGHISIIAIIRFHVKSTNFLKNKFGELKEKIIEMTKKKDENGNPIPEAPVSKFLKMMSDYKHKIRDIKHKIHEEEENN